MYKNNLTTAVSEESDGREVVNHGRDGLEERAYCYSTWRLRVCVSAGSARNVAHRTKRPAEALESRETTMMMVDASTPRSS